MKRAILVMGKNIMLQESKAILPFADFQVVASTGNGMEGLQLVTRYEPNLVILGWNLPGLSASELVSSIMIKHLCPVVIGLLPEEHEAINPAVETGAHQVVLYPFRPTDFVASILQAEAHFQRESKFRLKIQGLEDELKDRKLIYQAILCLIGNYNCTETQAYSVLRQQAMKTRKSIGSVALSVTKGTWLPWEGKESFE